MLNQLDRKQDMHQAVIIVHSRLQQPESSASPVFAGRQKPLNIDPQNLAQITEFNLNFSGLCIHTQGVSDLERSIMRPDNEEGMKI